MLKASAFAVILAFAAVCGPADADGADRPHPGTGLFGAYYYPWYYPERWTNEPVADTPTIGWYSSDDRAVAARHVETARKAGLDFFMVSWINPEGPEDRNLKDALLPEVEKAGFRFALLYDTALSLGLPAGQPLDFDAEIPGSGGKAGERFVAHFDYLAENYLKRDSYLTVDGKAVVCVYLVRDMTNYGPYVQRVRERLRDRNVELHLIADLVYWAPPGQTDWAAVKEHFQSVTAYNMYFRPKFLEAVRDQYAAYAAAAREHGLGFVPNVMPGYDDTPLRGEGRATLHRRRGAFYREFWEVADPYVTAEQPMILVTSFNEWHEGTEVEPSEEYGDRYVELTRELIEGTNYRLRAGQPR
jgi:hypothetical protein